MGRDRRSDNRSRAAVRSAHSLPHVSIASTPPNELSSSVPRSRERSSIVLRSNRSRRGERSPPSNEALAALSRKELIRPERPVFQGEEAYSFRHLLIRDAAYASIPKQAPRRAARAARQLAARADRHAVVEYDEIVGYHLEQSVRHRAELGPVDAEGAPLGRRAAELLGAAGRRAFLRSDAPAGVNLFARAVAMLSPDDPLRVDLVPNVRVVQGLRDLSWAERVLTEAIEASATTGDRGSLRMRSFSAGCFASSATDVTPSELLDVGGAEP